MAFDDKVKIVILIHVNPSARTITIERWEMVSPCVASSHEGTNNRYYC